MKTNDGFMEALKEVWRRQGYIVKELKGYYRTNIAGNTERVIAVIIKKGHRKDEN